MSAGPATIRVTPRLERSGGDRSEELSEPGRRLIRLSSFAALGAYGVIRWATLLSPAPSGRLLGLLALAVGLAGTVPLLRRYGRAPAVVAAFALCLLALPMAGLPWHDFVHVHLAVGARELANGLSGLPSSFVPYGGPSHAVRLVIVLGAAVLLLDGAMVLAFAPGSFGDGRRAGAALPLIALAVVPSTLVRPQLPYLQGLVLFGLLVGFLWGERARREGAGAAIILLGVAGVAGAVIAPRLDQHRPWVNYRAWAGTLARPRADAFSWDQNYGPLHWPRTGHVVLTVTALHGDYWKAEDLDVFNGTGWVAGPVNAPPLPAPRASSRRRWTQTIEVHDSGMRSSAVIAAGSAAAPDFVPGAVQPGTGAGTWSASRPLVPGDRYVVRTYSPRPSADQLARAGGRYPNGDLVPYLTLTLPIAAPSGPATSEVQFAAFHSTGPSLAAQIVSRSAYAPVYALAQRMAADAATPYAYAKAITRYLSAGYAYNENPPVRRYPLVSFLFKDKLGYCQQFSGAMALLLRMGGVPARVAAGFTSGAPVSGHRWVVTDIDAHAWVEAWFPKYGWVRFDPTPTAAPALGGNSPAPSLKNLPGESNAVTPAPRRAASPGTVPTRAHQGGSAAGASLWLIVPGVFLLGALTLLAAGLVAPEPSPEDRLRELERALARTGRPLGSDVTLAMLEQRFHDSPGAAGYIRALRLRRFAQSSAPLTPSGRRALREQLRQGLGLTGGLRALWALPPRLGTRLRRRAGRLDS